MNSTPLPITFADILIVDDKPDNLRVLSTLLTDHGYQVRKVINGYLALKVAQNAQPTLILLDILMPEMDGYEVCSLLKANPQTSEIPVIFISALDDTFDKVKAFNVGGVDYITKPFHEAEVIVRVRNQVNLRNLYVQIQAQAKQLAAQNLLLQQEIKERQRAEAETQLLLRTIHAITEAEDFHAALEVTLQQVCETINWDFGEAWIPNEHIQVLESSRGGYSKGNLQEFRQHSQSLKFAPNIGLPGQVWKSKQTRWIEDVGAEQHQVFLRSEIAFKAGLKTALGVPLIVDNEVLAVLVFFKKEKLKPQSRLIELLDAIATQLSSVIQRKKAEVASKVANLELERLACLDELTGVANRRRFNQYLNEEWRRMAREQLPLSLILCDLDYFKNYNDAYGHLAGDFCLQKISQTIEKNIKRPADLVSRYGGEEFVIILPNTQAEGALNLAELIRLEVENLKIPHALSVGAPYMTLSSGVASLVPDPQGDPSLIIAWADQALYQAKNSGRNCSVLKVFPT